MHEARSEFSHIRIYDRRDTRFLMFVRDNDQEVTESAIEPADPDRLALHYTRLMFASHLFRPDARRALLIGLGGGSMVRFMRRFFPDMDITAVDIDPVIVDVARRFWAVEAGPNLEVLVEDGFEYIARDGDRFDVIYLDAFLKPSIQTDQEGAPLRMQTLDFLRQLRGRLTEQGVLVININVTDDTPEDLDTLREAFPHVHLFDRGNLIVVATRSDEDVTRVTMRRNARRLDARADYGFTFSEFLRYHQRSSDGG